MDKKLKKKIQKAAKREFPTDSNDFGLYDGTAIAKRFEQPAFIEGANWAIKNLSTEPSDYVKRQIELLKWLQDQIGTDYSLSPHETYEQLVERFNKERK